MKQHFPCNFWQAWNLFLQQRFFPRNIIKGLYFNEDLRFFAIYPEFRGLMSRTNFGFGSNALKYMISILDIVQKTFFFICSKTFFAIFLQLLVVYRPMGPQIRIWRIEIHNARWIWSKVCFVSRFCYYCY